MGIAALHPSTRAGTSLEQSAYTIFKKKILKILQRSSGRIFTSLNFLFGMNVKMKTPFWLLLCFCFHFIASEYPDTIFRYVNESKYFSGRVIRNPPIKGKFAFTSSWFWLEISFNLNRNCFLSAV